MKKLIAVIYAVCSFLIMQAQMVDDTTSKTIESGTIERDRFIFSVHWDGWLNAPDSLKVSAISRGIGFHFYYDIY